jgi:hypothetical protein
MSQSSDADAVDSPGARTGAVRAAPPAEETTRVQETVTPTSAAPAAEPPPPPAPISAATSRDPGTSDEPSKLQSLIAEKPELLVLGAFAGGLVLAIIIRRLGH